MMWLNLSKLGRRKKIKILTLQGVPTTIETEQIEGFHIPLRPEPYEIVLKSGKHIQIHESSHKIEGKDPEIKIRVY